MSAPRSLLSVVATTAALLLVAPAAAAVAAGPADDPAPPRHETPLMMTTDFGDQQRWVGVLDGVGSTMIDSPLFGLERARAQASTVTLPQAGTRGQIVDLTVGKCLTTQGTDGVRTVPCRADDPDQQFSVAEGDRDRFEIGQGGGDEATTLSWSTVFAHWRMKATPGPTDVTTFEGADRRPSARPHPRVGVSAPAAPVVSTIKRWVEVFHVFGVSPDSARVSALLDGQPVGTTDQAGRVFSSEVPATLEGREIELQAFADGLVSSTTTILAETPEETPAPVERPRVHGLSELGADGDLWLEGTAAHDPLDPEPTLVVVTAGEDRELLGLADRHNGAFGMTVPREHRGEPVQVVALHAGTYSDETVVDATPAPSDAPVAYPLEVASPADGSTVTTPTPTFTGDAIPGSTITVTTTSTSTSTTDTATCDADVLADGTWTCDTTTPLSDGTHTTTITETPWWASAGTPTTTTTYTVTTTDDDTRPSVDVTSHTTGDTFIPTRTTTFHGTGTPGATITLTPQGNLLPVTATVQDDTDGDGRGTWSTTKFLGTGTYHLTATQTLDDEPVGDPVTDLTIHPATTAPLTLASHTDGDTFTPNTTATFTGTASPHAHIVIRPHGGLPPVTTDADDDGNWSTTRFLGGGTYHLTITQHLDGEPWGTPTRLTITPTTPLP